MELHAVCIQTHQPEELVAFYTLVFGHPPEEVDGHVDFRFVQEQLTIFRLEAEDAPPTTDLALVYTVDAVDATYTRLSTLGIPALSPPTDKPWGVRSFLAVDPQGITLNFVQPTK